MGKGGGAGSETADNIQSNVKLKVIDLLGEGEIYGIVDDTGSNANPTRGVYFDTTAIQNSDGTNNYQLDSFSWLNGSNNQVPVPGYNSVKSEVSVGQKITKPLFAVRTVTIQNLDAVVVTIAIPRLVKYKDDGGSEGTSVRVQLFLKIDNGLHVLQHDVEYDRKSSGGFEWQRRIELPNTYSDFQIKVVRITDDSTSDKLSNETQWKSYSTVIDRKFNYPNLAIAAFALDSKVITSGVPARKYRTRAIKVRIPSNAVVNLDGSLTYTGAWDGQFQTPVWCADPAWCLYNFILNNRYGIGVSETIIDPSKWEYYAASQWCNGLVSDGKGGTEPRFLISLTIDREYEVYELLSLFASIFNGIYFLSENKLSLAVDRPSDPVATLTNDKAKFNYQDAARRNRYTVAVVSWQNPELLGETDTTVVEDRLGIALYGYRTIEVSAVGCNRLSQARRYGLTYLYTNRLQADTISAMVGQIGCRFKPGEIVYVADRNKIPVLSGRLISVSGNAFTLDRSVTLASGVVYGLYCSLPNGILEIRNISNIPGTYTTVTVTTLFTDPPLPNATWILVDPSKPLPQYRILSASRKTAPEYELLLVKHDPNKYADIEGDLAISTPIITQVTTTGTVNKPRNIATVVDNQNGIYIVDISWDYPLFGGDPDPYISSYVVRYRKTDVNTFTEVASDTRNFELTGLIPGEYIIDVKAVDIYNRSSAYTIGPVTLVGLPVTLSAQFGNVDSSMFIPLLTLH